MPEPQTQATTPPGADAIPRDAAMLAATLLEHSMAETQSVTNRLLEQYRLSEMLARTELIMVREALQRVLLQPYAPSSTAIEDAMYPDHNVVAARANADLDKELGRG